jgi:ATP-dependent RNA helicase RhlE
MTDFNLLGLNQSILNSLSNKGYKKPTSVQERAIPALLKGKDILGISQTGTGKTASFSLPIIELLNRELTLLEPYEVQAIILAPTRELATQIYSNISTYSSELDVTSAIVIGGVLKESQVEVLKNGVDIVVATPGRFLDLMRDSYLVLRKVKFFVLDEADMMLDMGFLKDVEIISSALPIKKQSILFSATMPRKIERLANTILNNPIKIEVNPESSTIEKISQTLYNIKEENKIKLVLSLLKSNNFEKVLIFCKAKYSVANVVEALNISNFENTEIHSNRSQIQRDQAIEDFSSGGINILVATDIASRGIDVNDVSHVINFNIPEDPTYYVHRIGRTARAGREGISITLCSEREIPLLRNIQKLIKEEIPLICNHDFHEDYTHIIEKAKKKKPSSRTRQRKKLTQAKRAAKKKRESKLLK